MNWLLAPRVRTVLLPLALSAATVLGLGSYYETNDDTTLAWLFSGGLALKPVPSVPLFMHGYGHVLAAAYTAAPGVPWLGLLLGALLVAATALFFAVLDKLLRPHLRPAPLAMVLTLFFGLGWLEHWLWFSHGRVALLLAGAGVLFAAQRPAKRWALLLGLAALGSAWLVRPSLAMLGVAAAAPAALLLAGSWRRAAPVLASAVLGLLLATGLLHWQQTPAEARAQRLDATFSRILDFNQLRPQPRTSADCLGAGAISLWLLGDSAAVNEGLSRRAYHFDAAQFFGQEVPAKLLLRLGLLARDYFALLLALAASVVLVARRQGWGVGFWLVQASFVGGLMLLAGLLKLPPRLALPLLDFWLLTNVAFWLKPLPPGAPAVAAGRRLMLPSAPLVRGVGAAALLIVVALYTAKTVHRQTTLQHEQLHHTRSLLRIRQRGAHSVCIMAGTNHLLKSLSPFRSYSPGPGPVLLLTGWSAYDASQGPLRQALSGATDQAECLRRLARLSGAGPSPQVLWVLTPETAQWLNQRFHAANSVQRLTPYASLLPDSGPGMGLYYRIQASPKQQ